MTHREALLMVDRLASGEWPMVPEEVEEAIRLLGEHPELDIAVGHLRRQEWADCALAIRRHRAATEPPC